MNVEEMLIETLNDDEAWGRSQWTDPVGRIAARYQRRRRRRFAAAGAAVAVAAIAATVVVPGQLRGHSHANLRPAEPKQDRIDTTISRTVLVDGVPWTVNASPKSAGACAAVSIEAETVVRGCAVPLHHFLWSAGDMRVPGWYQFAYGHAPADAVEIRVRLANGEVLVDDQLTSDRLWLIARPGKPDIANRFRSIAAYDAYGQQVARRIVHPD